MSGYMRLMHTRYSHAMTEGELSNKTYKMMKRSCHHGPEQKDSRVRAHVAAEAKGSWRHVGRDILYKGKINLTGRTEISVGAYGMIDQNEKMFCTDSNS